ncbi:MAG: fibronectin type III domain-containing protein, partial [Gorillibacterium sp.]|nr:fibronectin type III domain-containing protein [Gorillibacterium sp.]
MMEVGLRMMKGKRIISFFLVLILIFTTMPALLVAAESGEWVRVNLLAADMDTHFNGGISPFTQDNTTTGGSQQIVQVNGNNALELRDAALGTNAASYFYYQSTSGTLLSRINDIYSMQAGTAPVEFVLEYKLMRSAASDKAVAKDIYGHIQFAPYDESILVPRFPVGAAPSMTGTAAYLSHEPNVLKTINDSDIASYRFKIVPNGGQKKLTSLKLGFSVRVDTGGTEEAIIVDDLAIYELKLDGELDTLAPTVPANLTVTAKTDTRVGLSWTASTDNVAVTRYDIYQNGQLAGTVDGATTSYTFAGLSPNTTYVYTVKARDGMGNLSEASNEVSVQTNPSIGGLPEPFGDQDIGTVRLAGSASYVTDTGTFSVKASGADIWGTEDAFHYVYRPWTGDGQIIARVANLENAVAWTKAGIMIRENVSSQSPHVMMAVSPVNGVVFEDRLLAGGASTLTSGTKAATPYWVKLVRVGNVISAYDSFDGVNWTLIKKESVNFPETVYFGLALTSHDNGRLTTAQFSDVTISDAPPADSTYSPFPGTVETRRDWLWNRTKTMSEIGGPLNIVQYVAQLLDGQSTAGNLQKLDTMFQTYDWEQYKTVSKMYAYLLAGDKFDSTMMEHVKNYFAGYAYAKLPQTENLRMSNYTVGYLVGQYFPDIVDLNGVSGATLKSMNRANVEEMLEAAVHEGWAEYESSEYTFMTYLCLNALYQYSDEPDFKQKLKMTMDVMWLEWANDWIDGTIISTTSRAKGDSVSASDPTWRGADHTALSWMYFGAHRAQQGIGESDKLVPAAYRPFLEYLGMVLAPGMSYTPPELAIQIGQSAEKNYTSRKTNLQNSSGRNLKTYRQAYVKPTWGLATEVTYN